MYILNSKYAYDEIELKVYNNNRYEVHSIQARKVHFTLEKDEDKTRFVALDKIMKSLEDSFSLSLM